MEGVLLLGQFADGEGELAVVIGVPCKNVKAKDWKSVVRGVTIINDVSSRDLQFADGQWARAKGIDTFGPLGPWIETDLDKFDFENLPIKAHLTHDGKRVVNEAEAAAMDADDVEQEQIKIRK